jgi:hypothetical protein
MQLLTTINEFKPSKCVTEASNPASWPSNTDAQKQFNPDNFKVPNVPLSNWNVSFQEFKPASKKTEEPAKEPSKEPAKEPVQEAPKETPKEQTLLQKLKDSGLNDDDLEKAKKILEVLLQSSCEPAMKIEAFRELKSLAICSADKAPEHAYWPS